MLKSIQLLRENVKNAGIINYTSGLCRQDQQMSQKPSSSSALNASLPGGNIDNFLIVKKLSII